MKTLPLLVLVLAGTAVLADPGWIRRAPLEADKRAYGMFTSPDGITVDYIVHHGGRLGELHFYDVNEFFYVKSVSSKVCTSTSWFSLSGINAQRRDI